jgi:hypothetical protein
MVATKKLRIRYFIISPYRAKRGGSMQAGGATSAQPGLPCG